MTDLKVALVVNCSSINHIEYFLKSYLLCKAGYEHDLIIIHRNFEYINKDNIKNTSDGNIIYVNKILPDNTEVEHRANGSFRYIYNIYKNNYDMFIFMVDHCVIRRDNWIKDAVTLLYSHEKIGFIGSQIFNGHKRYPHPSHVRTICYIVKSSALSTVNWEFNSDSDGELKFGDMIVDQGYIGLQIGNKLNFAYDSKGDPPPPNTIPTAGNLHHVTHYLENKYFPDKHLLKKHEVNEFKLLEYIYNNNRENIQNYEFYMQSPHAHIGMQHMFIDIEPFDKLIYYPSLPLCYKYFPERVNNIGNNIYVLDIN